MIMLHHTLWFYYQLAWIIPANLILAYRFYTRKDYSNYMVREKFDSYTDALNILDLNPYKHKVKAS